ncbi:hypothetical protein OSB04_006849 [Centaurea solstitialis]|uniref:CCHC-type domain-containing protein n=1 Tax=Centaurea solstitialis TaxID=347529 RepID=A0AA38TIR5_9ASTR|nr:hypothetical protein OSB04_006849 [Centaurea solstitialis]
MATFPSKDSYFDSGSLAKPPRFMPENFPLWKSQMELFLAGSIPQIPYFIEHGPHVPTSKIPSVAATDNTPAVQKRSFVKLVANWSDEDRRLVNIDTKARSLIAMSLPDEVIHSISKIKFAKEILQYEGIDALMESRKIHLIRQYEKFIAVKDETLSQTHQRFNCLLIDLKTYDVSYSNSQVITKFMEALPDHWENYTMCLKMSKDIKTITLSELYGMMLNHEQHKTLKSNLIRDTKDVKSTSLALISDSPQPSNPVSTVTITEIEDSDSNHVSDTETELNESLALLSKHFKKFGRKGNFRKSKPLSLTNKAETPSGDKASATCFKCQGKGHYATECRYKKNQFAESSSPASKEDKYWKLKAKYRKLKYQRKGKGLIAEGKGWDDSSDEEDTTKATYLMAIIEEAGPVLMAQLEDIPEEVPATPTSSSLPPFQVSTPSPSDTMSAMDTLTIDLHNALNNKSSAEKINLDLRTELKECYEKLKELAIYEASYKDQVHVNQILCLEREQAIAEKEKVLAELYSEKVTVNSWVDASETVDKIISSQRHPKIRTCLGFNKDNLHADDIPDKSSLKFGMFVSSNSCPSDENDSTSDQPSMDRNFSLQPPKPSKTYFKTPKVLGGGPPRSGKLKTGQNPVPKLKVDIISKPAKKTQFPPQTTEKGFLGQGPTHLRFKHPKGSLSKAKTFRSCYHCGQNDHIASNCPNATKAEKAAKVKKGPKAEKSVKGKNPLIPDASSIPDPVNSEKSEMTDAIASTSNAMIFYGKGIWYLDSGCSKHMTGNKHVLVDFKEEAGPSVKCQLCDKDHKVSFSKKDCKVKNRHKKVILRGQRFRDVYTINMDTSIENVCFMSRASSDINWLWHKRLSHLNFKTANQLSINNLVDGLPEKSFAKESLCSLCEKGKSKSDASQEIINFILQMEKYNQITVPARSMLIEARLPLQLWAKAVNTACYTQNRSLIVKRFKKTAYELFRGRKPNISYFHIFGCNCYIKNDRDNLGKFDAKANDGFLVGYSTVSKAYRVFNKRRQTLEETIHVKFDEIDPFSSAPSFY